MVHELVRLSGIDDDENALHEAAEYQHMEIMAFMTDAGVGCSSCGSRLVGCYRTGGFVCRRWELL